MRTSIEALFRRRFFVVHLVLLAAAAVLAARTVTTVVGHIVVEKLAGEQGAGRSARRAPPAKAAPPRDFDGVANANIFEARRELVLETSAGPEVDTPPGDAGDCDGAPSSSLRMRLVGTAVFSDPAFSLASIVDESKGGAPAETFSINECVDQELDPDDPNSKLAAKPPPCNRIGDTALVRRIEPERVCIWNENDNRMESLAIDEKKERVLVASRAPVEAKEDGGDVAIRKTGDNTYEVGRSEVDKALNNLSELATQARVVPAFEGGKTVGFKLFSIRPGSLYSKIGLQNGDVITRINGYEMTDPAKGLEIYGKLKDTTQVTVDLKRRGKPMVLDYAITP